MSMKSLLLVGGQHSLNEQYLCLSFYNRLKLFKVCSIDILLALHGECKFCSQDLWNMQKLEIEEEYQQQQQQ